MHAWGTVGRTRGNHWLSPAGRGVALFYIAQMVATHRVGRDTDRTEAPRQPLHKCAGTLAMPAQNSRRNSSVQGTVRLRGSIYIYSTHLFVCAPLVG